jgi:aryl-alcohol dehydrogenase-like predicted oxidoreductase
MFGGNVFGWTADEATSHRLLDMFVDAGFDAIDTADVYSRWVPGHAGGESEAVIGRWLKERRGRDRVVIATKVGMDMGEGRQGLSPAWIERAVDDSLRRLDTDYIDLYQSHRDDEDTPVEQTLEAYGRLIKAGKVRAIGASNFTADRLGAALAAAGPSCPATRRSSRSTTSSTAPPSRARSRTSASARASASSATTASPPASSAASTAPRPTSPARRAAAR